MARRRQKKPVRVIPLSHGPLPRKFDGQFTTCPLVFSDASRQERGGLAAVIYTNADLTPQVLTRTVPAIGSNELELQAALMALDHMARHFPGRAFALFSDNLDTVNRLCRFKMQGLPDEAITAHQAVDALPLMLDQATITWIPGHAACRGNAMADEHARLAASAAGPCHTTND